MGNPAAGDHHDEYYDYDYDDHEDDDYDIDDDDDFNAVYDDVYDDENQITTILSATLTQMLANAEVKKEEENSDQSLN